MSLELDFIKALDYMQPHCPNWVEKIENDILEFTEFPFCDLEACEWCVVGEAHKNSADYRCDICDDYARELYRSARVNDSLVITEEFKKVFINFSEHWKDHVILFQENILALEEIN